MEMEIEEMSVGEQLKSKYERELLEEKNKLENLKLEYERRLREEYDKYCKLIKDYEEVQNKLREKNKLIHNWAEQAKTMRRKNNPFTKECKHFRDMLNVFQQGVNLIGLTTTINKKVSKKSNKEEKERLEKENKELKDELMNSSFIMKQQRFKIDELQKELSQKPIKTKKKIKKKILPTVLPHTPDSFEAGDSIASDKIEVKCTKTSLSNAGETFNLHESQCNLPNAGTSESLGICVLERDSKSNKDILCVNSIEAIIPQYIEDEPKSDDVYDVLKYMKCPSPISFQGMHLSPIKIHSLKGKNGTERIENKQTGIVYTSYDDQNRSRHSHIARNLSFEISDNNCNSDMSSNIANEPTHNIFYNSSKTMKQPLIISSCIMGDDNLDRSPKVLSSSVAIVDKTITSSDIRNKDCSITHSSVKDESQQSKSTCENFPLNNDGPTMLTAKAINILPFHFKEHNYYCIPKSSALPCNDHSYSLSSINTQEEVVTPESCKTDHTSSSSRSDLNNVSITMCDESVISDRDIDISNKFELELCTDTKTGFEPQNPSNSQKAEIPLENSNSQLKNIKKPHETASVDNVNILIPSMNYRTKMTDRKRQQVNIMPILRPNRSPCSFKQMKPNYFDNLPSKPLAENEKITSKLKNLPTVKKENPSFQLSPIYQTNTANKSKRTRKINDRNTRKPSQVTQTGLSSLSFEKKNDSTEITKISVSSPIDMKNISANLANDRKQIDSHSQVTYLLPSPCLLQQTNIFNCDRLPSKSLDIPIQQSSTASAQLKSIDDSGKSVLSHHQLSATIEESKTAQAEKSSNFTPKFYCEYENSVNTELKSFEAKIEGKLHEESKPIFKMQIQLNIHKQKTLNELIPQGEKVDVCGNILRTVIDKHKRDINIYKSRNNSEHRKLICTKPGKNYKKISEVMLEFFHGGRTDMNDIINTVDKIKDYSCSKILIGLFKAVSQEIDTCLSTSIGRSDKLYSKWILGIGSDTNLKNPQIPKLHQIVLAVIVIIIKVRNHKCQTPEQISNFMEEALEFIEKILLESINLNLHTVRDFQIFSAQLYTGLARLSGKLVRVRRFLFDMLYCFVNKSLNVFHTAMMVWPAVLPLKTIQNYFGDPIALSIFSAFKNGRNVSLQHLFRIPYNNPVYNADDLFDMCVNHIHQEGVFEALVLLCKRNNCDWFTKRPLTVLIGMVKEWYANRTSDLTAASAIRILGATARPLNPAKSQHILEPLFNLLRDILYDPKTPDWMAEIVVVNLCYLSRLNLSVCTDIISGWKPKQVSSEVIDQILLNIVSKQKRKKKSMLVYLNK